VMNLHRSVSQILKPKPATAGLRSPTSGSNAGFNVGSNVRSFGHEIPDTHPTKPDINGLRSKSPSLAQDNPRHPSCGQVCANPPISRAMATTSFIKMHGAGNDFVVLDRRDGTPAPDADAAAAIADRHRGIGCDQLIIIEPSQTGMADVGLIFLNSDGSESGACGNGTRCAASLLMDESGADQITIETGGGMLDCERTDRGVVVDMGRPRLKWDEIPLSEDRDTLNLGIAVGPLSDPVAVSMGNPHAVFFVEDAEAVELERWGPKMEHHKLYPERANVQIVQVIDRGQLRQRTWERGAGITLASGSGACAGLVAASRRGLADRKADILMNGGTLSIEWMEDDHILMTGPVATSFTGELDPHLFQANNG
jgi:diaminopimelate epimerase